MLIKFGKQKQTKTTRNPGAQTKQGYGIGYKCAKQM